MSKRDSRPEKDAAPNDHRHPSNDPSGDEPAGSSTGHPGRGFARDELDEAESEQARGRRDSAAERERSLRPPDKEIPEQPRP